MLTISISASEQVSSNPCRGFSMWVSETGNLNIWVSPFNPIIMLLVAKYKMMQNT